MWRAQPYPGGRGAPAGGRGAPKIPVTAGRPAGGRGISGLPTSVTARTKLAGVETALKSRGGQPPGVLAVDGEHTFNKKYRRVVEHQVRTPHRTTIPPQLLTIVAHWTAQEEGSIPLEGKYVEVEVNQGDADTIDPPVGERETPQGAVDARALICVGLRPVEGHNSEAGTTMVEVTDAAPKPPPAGGASASVLSRVELLCFKRKPGTGPNASSPATAITGIAPRFPGDGNLAAYGGEVVGGSDPRIIKQLCDLVYEQSGLNLERVKKWYKFVELQYLDQMPTVYFMPAIWEASRELSMKPQANKLEVPCEEEYSEDVTDKEAMEQREAERAAAKAERKAQREAARQEAEEEEARREAEEDARREAEGKKKKKKKKEKKEKLQIESEGDDEMEEDLPKLTKRVKKKRPGKKIIKDMLLTPQRVTLSRMLHHPLTVGQKTEPKETIEFCTAVDALDEFLKREMAARILAVLREKSTAHRERETNTKKQEEERSARKRQRADEAAAIKRMRKEEEAELRRKWDEDDEGKTEEDLREARKVREAQLETLRQEYLKQDRERLEKELAQLRDEETKRGTKYVTETRQAVLDAFGYFDPWGRGTMSRIRLENLLLALNEDMTMGDINNLFDFPDVPSRSAVISYRPIGNLQREVQKDKKEKKSKKDRK